MRLRPTTVRRRRASRAASLDHLAARGSAAPFTRLTLAVCGSAAPLARLALVARGLAAPVTRLALVVYALAALFASLLGWRSLAAVAQVGEATEFVVRGELRVGADLADSGSVVLHRVSVPFTGAVDTVSVGAGGRFELRIPGTAAAGGELFFASVRYDDVLYFGDPITSPWEPDSVYVVRGYPSLPAGTVPAPAVSVRNLILESGGPGQGWSATDVFQVGNAGEATVVASEEGASWSHALPPGATEFRTGAGDLSAPSATLSRGRVEVSEPVPPGATVWVFHYRIPFDDFEVPLEGVTGSMELLVRAGSTVGEVDGLAPAGEAELEGDVYHRFAGRDLAPAAVKVRARAAGGLSGAPLAAVLAALALGVAGTVVAARRGGGLFGAGPGRRLVRSNGGLDRRALLVAVAELDEAAWAGEMDAAEHRRRRRALLKRLDA